MRKAELDGILSDCGAYPKHPNSFQWWKNFREHHILPFSGSWLDQPQWWLDDVRYFELLDEFVNIPYMVESARRNLAASLERRV
jgi:hypothetical protein